MNFEIIGAIRKLVNFYTTKVINVLDFIQWLIFDLKIISSKRLMILQKKKVMINEIILTSRITYRTNLQIFPFS